MLGVLLDIKQESSQTMQEHHKTVVAALELNYQRLEKLEEKQHEWMRAQQESITKVEQQMLDLQEKMLQMQQQQQDETQKILRLLQGTLTKANENEIKAAWRAHHAQTELQKTTEELEKTKKELEKTKEEPHKTKEELEKTKEELEKIKKELRKTQEQLNTQAGHKMDAMMAVMMGLMTPPHKRVPRAISAASIQKIDLSKTLVVEVPTECLAALLGPMQAGAMQAGVMQAGPMQAGPMQAGPMKTRQEIVVVADAIPPPIIDFSQICVIPDEPSPEVRDGSEGE